MQPQLSWANDPLTAAGVADLSGSAKAADSGDSDEVSDPFEEAVNAAFATDNGGWDDNWNEEQKALYLHDYLVTHCDRDAASDSQACSASDALVNGKATSEGYALAYECLLERAGLTGRVVTSESLQHAWNLVTVDDQEYVVDCNWDELIPRSGDLPNLEQPRIVAYCGHENFLCSKSGFQAFVKNHVVAESAADWVDSSGNSVSLDDSGESSGAYDSAYWRGVTTAIPHVGDLWAYVKEARVASEKSVQISVHDYSSDEDRVLSGEIPATWTLLSSSGTGDPVLIAGSVATFRDHFTSLVSNGAEFLATAPTGLYCISTDGATEQVYTLSNEEKKLGQVYGLLYDRNDKTCAYGLNRQRSSEGTQSTFKFPDGADSVLGISISSTSGRVVKGKTISLGASVLPSWASNKDITWSSNESEIATVDASGTVKGVAVGSAVITATSADSGCSATCTVAVGNSIGNASVSVATQTYTGSALKPAPTVKIGNTTLKKGTDYKVTSATYANNKKAGNKTAQVKVTIAGIGAYAGTLTKTVKFTINKRSLKSATVSNVTYTGKAASPAVKVGNVKYTSGTDYTITYKNSKGKAVAAKDLKAVGTYTAVVKGKGSCTGTATKTFKIVKAANPLTLVPDNVTYKVKDPYKGKGLGLSVSGLIAKKGVGKMSYALASGNNGKVFSAINSQGYVSVKKGYKNGTAYLLKVKMTAAGNTNYKSASKTVAVKFKFVW